MSVPPLSIRQKLPLLICALLLAVMGSFSWAAYRGVRRAAIATAGERLSSVSQQLAGLLRASASQRRTAAHTSAAAAAITDYLRSPTARSRVKALAALQPTGPQSQQVAENALWNPRGERVLSTAVAGEGTGGGRAVTGIDTALLHAALGPDTGVVSPFRAVGDSVQYATVVPVTKGGRVLGYLSEVRRLTSSPQGREQLNRLIGAGTALYLGNTAGDVWTDMSRVAPHPPVDLRAAGGLLQYERPGTGPVFAAASAIARTPWTVVVEFPRAEVLAPARRFLRGLALI